MTAFEGDSVDNPDIPLVTHRTDHLIGNGTMLTAQVDGLLLRLSGDRLPVFVASLDPALEPAYRSGSNRLSLKKKRLVWFYFPTLSKIWQK